MNSSFERLRTVALDAPLPSQVSARIFQDGWSQECRGAIEFMHAQRDDNARRVIAEVMIDRALFALEQASNHKVGLYAAIGALRFTTFRRVRFPEVKERILRFFLDNPPDSVRQRLEQVEDSLYRQ